MIAPAFGRRRGLTFKWSWLNIQKVNCIIHCINRPKDMTMSINAEKASDKIQPSFTVKSLVKLGIKGNFFTLIKGICKKHYS